jgi:hypothetical protein
MRTNVREWSVDHRGVGTFWAQSGPAEVVASGTVIGFRGNPIEVDLGPGSLKIRFRFIDEADGNQPPRVEGDNVSDKTLQLSFFNFTSPVGTGSIEPLWLGTENREEAAILLHYRIYALNSSDKTLQFTVYRQANAPVHEKA